MNKIQPKKKATLADAKRALHEMMVQDGLIYPETPEQIDQLEAKIDDSRLPTPDVNAFMKFLRGEAPAGSGKSPKILPFETAAYSDDSAMVARNGGAIDPAIRRRMDEHRAAAEKAKCKTK
jgi:hypothetical protein